MITRMVDPYKEALVVVEAAEDFISRMDFTEYFPKDRGEFLDALSRIFLADYVDILGVEHEGKLVGLIGMAYLPHLWNPKLVNGEELFWWTAPDAPKTAAMRLLKFAKQHSNNVGAKMVTFRSLTSSPKKVASVYKRMGLTEIETCYSGMI